MAPHLGWHFCFVFLINEAHVPCGVFISCYSGDAGGGRGGGGGIKSGSVVSWRSVTISGSMTRMFCLNQKKKKRESSSA